MSRPTPLRSGTEAKCPECGGRGGRLIFWDGTDEDGETWGEAEWINCAICAGSGHVASRIITWKHLQPVAYRNWREQLWRQRFLRQAREDGISADELIAMQRASVEELIHGCLSRPETK